MIENEATTHRDHIKQMLATLDNHATFNYDQNAYPIASNKMP